MYKNSFKPLFSVILNVQSEQQQRHQQQQQHNCLTITSYMLTNLASVTLQLVAIVYSSNHASDYFYFSG